MSEPRTETVTASDIIVAITERRPALHLILRFRDEAVAAERAWLAEAVEGLTAGEGRHSYHDDGDYSYVMPSRTEFRDAVLALFRDTET